VSMLRLTGAHLAFGHRALLEGADLELERGDRVALVGRNGTGKSSLLGILGGSIVADAGSLWIADGLRVGHLPQEVPPGGDVTIYDTVAEGLGELGAALGEYHRLSGEAASATASATASAAAAASALARLGELQTIIESRGGWNAFHQVEALLTRLALPADRRMRECSGGMRRLALLARALVAQPDILLLDEPTNHLDIDAIAHLEDLLLGFSGAVLLVSHDRALMKRVANRIAELDRGRLRMYPGDYETFLERRAALLEAEERAAALFDRNLADEEVWLRQGIKARRTRNEGRVRRLLQMRRERAERVGQQGRVALRLERGAASGAIVAELEDVWFGYDQPIVRGFSTTIVRGDRIGIIGRNGCGKSTLLRLMLGEVAPERGTVVRGTQLQVAYFDQQRETLDLERTVRDNVADGADFIDLQGRRRHVVGYLADFLFDPARVNSPVKSLSGGERNRLLLARLFARPANLLVLDEPTNDLDIETLELLEGLIAEYEGTLLLVSHDRAFIDAVVTSVIAFEGDGNVREYVGGYTDWERQRSLPAETGGRADGADKAAKQAAAGASGSTGDAAAAARRSRKLGYKEQRELEALPDRIDEIERRLTAVQGEISGPAFYQQPEETIRASLEQLADLEAQLAAAYERWSELEDRL
jgi:ABC transport system ATP-binding/permease protein